jgi:hypothetical protein
MKKLEKATGTYHGIDMDRMADRVATMLNTGIIERFTI